MYAPSVRSLSRIFAGTFCIGVLYTLCTLTAYATEFALSPNVGSYEVGQSFSVTVQINPEGERIKAVDAKLLFDNTKLSVQSVSKDVSAFTLWTTEPTFSNEEGIVLFGGGSHTPLTVRSDLLKITFETVARGKTPIKVASASAITVDGTEVDVDTNTAGGSYSILGTSDEPPQIPEVYSDVFLNPEIWYATTTGIFSWEVPADVYRIALDISTSTDTEPMTTHTPPIAEISLNSDTLEEGEQYMALQYRNEVGWSEILHRKIRIDTIPPQPFEIEVYNDNSTTTFPLVTFQSTDETSGIDYYELQVENNAPRTFSEEEADSGHLLSDLEDGTYTVYVRAYDKAGNMTESSTTVDIQAHWRPYAEVISPYSIPELFNGKNLLIFFLSLIVLGQIILFLQTKRQHKLLVQKHKNELREIQNQTEKVFSALRNEFHGEIHMVATHKRIPKKKLK